MQQNYNCQECSSAKLDVMEGYKRNQYLSALAVSLAVMATSAASFWSAPMVPKFYNNEISIKLTKNEISWVVAIGSPGFVIGSLLSAKISDKWGRKTALLGSALPSIIGSVLLLCATNAWMLYVGRFFGGSGYGMVGSVGSVYISEISDKAIRGKLSAGSRFFFNFGTSFVAVVGSFMSYHVFNSILIALPVCYFFACWSIPESPYYLLKEGKVDTAKNEYIHLSGIRDERIIEEKICLMHAEVKKDMLRKGSVKELLTRKQYRKAVIISVGLRLIYAMGGSFAIQQYLGHIIQESDCQINVSTGLIIYSAVRLIIGLTTPFIVEKIGRRPLLMNSYFIVSLIYAFVGLQVFSTVEVSSSLFRYLFFIGIISASCVGDMGFGHLTFTVPAEVFPLNVRSIAMTLLNIATALLTFISVKTYQSLEDYIELYGVFWFFAIVYLTGAIFTYFVVPETKGKTLRDIQIELQGNIHYESEVKLNNIVVNYDDIPIEDISDVLTDSQLLKSDNK